MEQLESRDQRPIIELATREEYEAFAALSKETQRLAVRVCCVNKLQRAMLLFAIEELPDA